MAYPEPEKLRQNARKFFDFLHQKRQKARAHAPENTNSTQASRTDFEPFLKNKLSSLSEKNSAHLTQHPCE
jgi:hypothetical protein